MEKLLIMKRYSLCVASGLCVSQLFYGFVITGAAFSKKIPRSKLTGYLFIKFSPLKGSAH